MKNKISLTGAVKVFGWVATAVGGILVAFSIYFSKKERTLYG